MHEVDIVIDKLLTISFRASRPFYFLLGHLYFSTTRLARDAMS